MVGQLVCWFVGLLICCSVDQSVGLGCFPPSWHDANDGYSGYIGIQVLIFGIQSDLDNVIRYYLYYLDKILYRGFLEQKGDLWSEKEVFQ